MKRIIITSLIMSCLLLSACTDSTSVGVIGGADGPTNIYVSSENGEAVKKPIRMIKVDGKLYYDSGKVSDMTARCGTLDGELKQVGEEYEIPQNDNECNFEGADGYQNATSITKEIPIDGDWVIFKLFDDSELDMSIFKYCFYLMGKSPNAEKESEIIALTEDINYDYSKHAERLFSSQYNPDGEKYATTFRPYGDYDKWGVTLSSKDITNTGLTILCEQFGGAPTGELRTGEWFSLEVIKDDEWKPVETNPLIDYAWNDVAYGIKSNDITELKVDWEWLYGELPPGFYKLKKEIMDFSAAGDYDKDLYELYFTIE
ncbi:MAG: hypothetical protein J6N52_00705 [Clostridia bacterium]|nr:hypothetical protein [Clostridia bacterium]